jgi:predicted nucleic acid-binding protein
MIQAVFLDSSPLSLLTQRRGKSAEVDACKQWLASLSLQGIRFYVPEIADYEVRRELLRAKKTAGIARLNRLKSTARYLPITTDVMLLAADLWAQARQQGVPTADPKELDGDVILAAQALTLGLSPADVVVATTNVGHLARFVAAER